MVDLRQQSLSGIVIGNHRATGVFEKFRIDYCYHGNRSLEEACAEQHVDIEEVINDLLNDISGNSVVNLPFDALPLSVLTDYIQNNHHAYTRREMPRIMELLSEARKYGQETPELLKVVEAFQAVREELELHMQKEERVLFPRINEIEKNKYRQGHSAFNISYIQSPITIMEQEHIHTGSLIEEIRNLTHDFTLPDDNLRYREAVEALQVFTSDLHQHVHLENNILFPRALDLFRKREKVAAN
jgi:regulator of cell morphogenesis and NO signaling